MRAFFSGAPDVQIGLGRTRPSPTREAFLRSVRRERMATTGRLRIGSFQQDACEKLPFSKC